jgi:hypothetical protein
VLAGETEGSITFYVGPKPPKKLDKNCTPPQAKRRVECHASTPSRESFIINTFKLEDVKSAG